MSEPFEEHAKAVTESAKALQKSLDVTEKAGRFVERYFGPAFQHVADVASMRLGYWKAKNVVSTFEKLEKLAQSHPRALEALKSLPPRQSVPLLDAIAVEDDESIQEIWARYLASGKTDSTGQITKHLTSAIKSLEPLDVVFLNYVAAQQIDRDRNEIELYSLADIVQQTGLEQEEVEECLYRFSAIGLLSFEQVRIESYLLRNERDKSVGPGRVQFGSSMGKYRPTGTLLRLLKILDEPSR